MNCHPISTQFSNLTNKEVGLLFSTENWNSPAMNNEAKLEACQELENRLAEQDGVLARNVFAEPLDGTERGYQTGSRIMVNSNVLNDGVTRTTSTDANGAKIVQEGAVPSSNWDVHDTICHEHTHGIQLDEGRLQDLSYINPLADYDLYRIQSSEREAYDAAREKTLAAIAAVLNERGHVDSGLQDYLDALARDSYQEALARAIAHYHDPNIQQTLDKVCADYEKGLRGNYQSKSEHAIIQILDGKQASAQNNAPTPKTITTEEEKAMETTANNVQDATQVENTMQTQDAEALSGWEADLAELSDGLSNEEEGLGEGQGEGQDTGMDNDDGMEM